MTSYQSAIHNFFKFVRKSVFFLRKLTSGYCYHFILTKQRKMVLGLWGLDELKASKPCESREPIYRLGVEQPLLH